MFYGYVFFNFVVGIRALTKRKLVDLDNQKKVLTFAILNYMEDEVEEAIRNQYKEQESVI